MKLINILVGIIFCCNSISCQEIKDRFFYNCTQEFHYKREIDTGDTLVIDTIHTRIIETLKLDNSKILIVVENFFPICDNFVREIQSCRTHFSKELLVFEKIAKRIYKINSYEVQNEEDFNRDKEKTLKNNYILLDSVYKFESSGSIISYNGKEKDNSKIYFLPYVDYSIPSLTNKEDINPAIFLEAEFPKFIGYQNDLKVFRRYDRHEGATNIALDSTFCIKQFSFYPNRGNINEYKFTLLNNCCKD